MILKKIILLFVLIAGLTSCSNDSQESNETEVTYADVKPTQTKYKAYFGEKLVKVNNASKSIETSLGTEMTRPVSVIYYPRTKTISFSNIFDTTTVEYQVTTIENNRIFIIYSFKINGVTATCKITFENSKAKSVVVTLGSEVYNFTVSLSESKKLAKLLIKNSNISPNPVDNYTKEYIYMDTLVTNAIYRYTDQKTLKDVVRYYEYLYDGSKLKVKNTIDENGNVLSKTTYTYTDNLITKAATTNAEGKLTGTTLHEYNSNNKVSAIKYFNSKMEFILARYYTYAKNTLTVKYTDMNDELTLTEVCTYDDERKIFIYSQDQLIDPFLHLRIIGSVLTYVDGETYTYLDTSFEYSSDGLLTKSITEDNVIQTFEYEEE